MLSAQGGIVGVSRPGSGVGLNDPYVFLSTQLIL